MDKLCPLELLIPSCAACASISASLGRGRAASSFDRLAASMSARLRRTIGIALLSVCITQADNPAHVAALRVDAVQDCMCDHTDRFYPNLATTASIIDRFGDWVVEEQRGEFERETPLLFVTLALDRPVSSSDRLSI
jgi:hypothetical protein